MKEKKAKLLEVLDSPDGGHTYQWKGKRVPGISEILEANDVLLKNSYYEERAEVAAIRGRDVHMATADLDRGYPQWWEDDPEISGYVEGWTKFKKDFSFEPHTIEAPTYSEIYEYACTPDRFGRVQLAGGWRHVTLEIKATAKIYPHVALQLAGQNQCADDADDRDLLVVQLKKNGKYVARNYDDRDHQTAVFLACLTLYKWKERHHAKEVR